MVKKRLKIRPVLVTLNILVLLIIVGFYSFRMIKYYLKENGKKENEEVLLVDSIIKKQSFVDLTKGLIFDEKDKILHVVSKEVKFPLVDNTKLIINDAIWTA